MKDVTLKFSNKKTNVGYNNQGHWRSKIGKIFYELQNSFIFLYFQDELQDLVEAPHIYELSYKLIYSFILSA